MPSTPMFATNVTITTKSINGDSVASFFPNVYNLGFDYFKGMINIVDANQGSFYFPLALVTTVTYTVAGTTVTVAIS